MKKQIRLSGAGGQGIISLGVMIAESAMFSGKKVIQSQTYGPEARGGSSKCEVIVSDEEIYFTKVIKPDIFLALNEKSYKTYAADVNDDTIIIIDDKIDAKEGPNVYSFPIIDTAINHFGKEIFANVISFGIISKFLDIEKDSTFEVIKKRTPKDSRDKNIEAFESGQKFFKNEN